MSSKKQVLISVGTYHFNPLLEKMDTPEMIAVLKKHGYDKVVYQYGRSTYEVKNAQKLIDTEVFSVTPKFDDYVAASALLIGHCGAGTILDAIKGGLAAVIVSNELMMHNHQRELLDALVDEEAIVGFKESGEVTPESMDAAITRIEKKLVKPLNFPKDSNIFRTILDEGKYD